MHINKLPIPLVLAAAALTSVAVIYVYLTAPPMPIHTDPNFTHPLYASGTYMWRGAAFEYQFSADEVMSLTHMAPYHLLYTTGPLGNFSIGSDVWVIHVYGERPLYVVRHYVYVPWAGYYSYEYFVFKLADVTPPNSTMSNLTMWLPRMFGITEYLTDREYQALEARVPVVHSHRVTTVVVNGTHLILRVAPLTSWGGSVERDMPTRMPPPVSGRNIRITNTPISSSYTIGGYSFTAIALPYRFFSITPSATTNLVIYVN